MRFFPHYQTSHFSPCLCLLTHTSPFSLLHNYTYTQLLHYNSNSSFITTLHPSLLPPFHSLPAAISSIMPTQHDGTDAPGNLLCFSDSLYHPFLTLSDLLPFRRFLCSPEATDKEEEQGEEEEEQEEEVLQKEYKRAHS